MPVSFKCSREKDVRYGNPFIVTRTREWCCVVLNGSVSGQKPLNIVITELNSRKVNLTSVTEITDFVSCLSEGNNV